MSWSAAYAAELMDEALAQAREASAAGEVPVGALVVYENRTVVRAQNRMRRDGDPLAHAEMVALREAVRLLGDGIRRATLVVTLEPCAMCAGAIVLARVERVVFGAWDEKAGMCGSVGDLVRHSKLNHQPQVQAGVHEHRSAVLLREFFAQRR